MTTPVEGPSSLMAGLRCCCPRCGRGKLFHGFLTLADSCDVCGLDYAALRPVKAWLIAEQYVRKASEATWDSLGTHGEAPPRYQAGRW